MSEHFVEERGVSRAWGRALQTVARSGRKEMVPLTVAITGADTEEVLSEPGAIRSELDLVLAARRKQTVETVANTIFPDSLWNPALPRQEFFDRYMTIYPRLQKRWGANRRGTYFQRMVAKGRKDEPNQLEFGLRAFGAGVRRSMLQVGVFDPRKDHSAATRGSGFPCLQHLSFAPDEARRKLSVNAFYASQYMVERGYGNYMGICRLGRFVAHELGIPLTRVTCHIGVAMLDGSKRSIAGVLAAVNAEIGKL